MLQPSIVSALLQTARRPDTPFALSNMCSSVPWSDVLQVILSRNPATCILDEAGTVLVYPDDQPLDLVATLDQQHVLYVADLAIAGLDARIKTDLIRRLCEHSSSSSSSDGKLPGMPCLKRSSLCFHALETPFSRRAAREQATATSQQQPG